MVLKFNMGRLKTSEYVFNQTLDLSNLNQTSDSTVRTIIPSAEITDKAGTKISVTVETWGSGVYPNIYIGKQASSGNDWDFDGNQVQLLFGGSSTVSGIGAFTSDFVDLDTDGTDNLVLAFYSSSSAKPKSTASGTGFFHGGFSGDSAADTAPAGPSAPTSILAFISKISVQ